MVAQYGLPITGIVLGNNGELLNWLGLNSSELIQLFNRLAACVDFLAGETLQKRLRAPVLLRCGDGMLQRDRDRLDEIAFRSY